MCQKAINGYEMSFKNNVCDQLDVLLFNVIYYLVIYFLDDIFCLNASFTFPLSGMAMVYDDQYPEKIMR